MSSSTRDPGVRYARRRVALAWLGTLALLTTAGLILTGGSHRRTSRHSHGELLPRARSAGTREGTRPQPSATRTRQSTRLDLARLVGQLIVGRFQGLHPSAAFLARVRAGQIGSIILFGDNTAGGPVSTRAIVRELQDAAREGHNPPLLVMTDQEGGAVRRLSGPPILPPAQMASDSIARAEGQAAGELLRSAGVNVDLAPVADVEASTGSFLGSRSFGTSPPVVAARACAFASGLSAAGVAYTLKHFPGLGAAAISTDSAAVSIGESPARIRAAYGAYETCGRRRLALVMVSSAAYPALAGPVPAVMSPATYQRELPLATGRPTPPTISDDLEARALAARPSAALTALAAGLDLALYASTERASAAAYSKLLDAARSGRLPLHRILQAADRIEALKRAVAGRPLA